MKIYLQIIYVIKDLYLDYKKHQTIKKNPKVDKLERQFSDKDAQMNRAHKNAQQQQ